MPATLIERQEAAAEPHRRGARAPQAAMGADEPIVLPDTPGAGRQARIRPTRTRHRVAQRGPRPSLALVEPGRVRSAPDALSRPNGPAARAPRRCSNVALLPVRSPARRTPRTRRQPVPVRLTRRGRLTVTVSTAVLVLSLSWVAHLSSAADAPPSPARGGQGAGAVSVVVRPGETLWDVATRIEPQGDPRVVVARIEQINSLDGPIVHPGQRLRLPAA